MKKFVAFAFGTLLSFSLCAQNRLQDADKEARKVFQAYASNFTLIIKKDKKAGIEFGKLFESGDVLVMNELDSSNATPISVRSSLPLMQKADTSIKITFLIKKVYPLKENPLRNYDEINIDYIVGLRKTIQHTDTSTDVVSDSLVIDKTNSRTMVLRIDESTSGGLIGRIVHIKQTGKENQLTTLHKDIQWWVSLSPEWRKIFAKKVELKKYPYAKDIENLAYIFDLDLSNTQISDISPLSRIKELRKLNLSNTPVEDISPLDSCKTLGELNLSHTKVRDISTLSKLKSLRKLYINNLDLVDLGPLKGLTKLTDLEASDNQINDIGPLASLINLEKLNLSVNKIFKLDALKPLVKLTDLRLGKNEIESIEPLSALTDLIRLDLFNNKITSLAPIRNHIKIAFLYIDFNPIKDLSPISRYGYLTHLSMEHTPVMDLSPISNSATMSYLNIAGTEISSLAAVDRFNVIKEFKMYH
ncbi:MAG TPA: leucine-rich repeat domain-containing protein, partial [Cytophagales bacterium]|nr:leucine-rich repeat domain-containing protein [Cytophagales bacterium]